MATKLETVVSDPGFVVRHLRTEASVVRELASRNLLEGLLYAPSILTEFDPYERYLRLRSRDGIVRRPVLDFEMFVDLDDEGISQQLVRTGVHERSATRFFEAELRRLHEAVDEVTVVEIGGNIGYYTLVETGVLGDDGAVYVVEPEPGNVDLLSMNVGLNGRSTRVDVTQGAISDEAGTTTLKLSEHSNCHTLEAGDERTSGESMAVETWTADGFVERKGLSPDDVNVLRMDVEGHEAKILGGAEDLLAGDGPTLVFVELHRTLLDNGELDAVIDTFREHGFELAYACVDHFARDPLAEPDSFEEIRPALRAHRSVEAFVTKGY